IFWVQPRVSSRQHPHDLVFPLLTFDAWITRSVPHSQRHSHLGRLPRSTTLMAVSLLIFCPEISRNFGMKYSDIDKDGTQWSKQ
ncbi:MAG TPA: hypothetical protein VJQ82_05750, partial [Terriglobales bacterium]|nr:hypothetical protein [Terriglobales bacterium]